MKKSLFVFCALLSVLAFTSCSDDEDVNVYDAYTLWPERNAAWYKVMSDSARTEIARAKTLYGEEHWQEHCDWRQYRDLSIQFGHSYTDSIVMRFVKRGDGMRPCYNDSVYVSYRGWLMPNTYRIDGRDTTYCAMIDQSFYGAYSAYATEPYDETTAHPIKSAVSTFVTGFNTALQNMNVGDQAHVYFPSDMGYGDSDSGVVPGGSTLHFFIHLAGAYSAEEAVPDWK